MSTTMRDQIRREVLQYLERQPGPVRMGFMAKELRSQNPNLNSLLDSELRRVVQPMIATGRLNYAPDLKIQLGRTTK